MQILLDSGASANTICARLVQNHKKNKLKFPVTWETASGSIDTTETIDIKFQISELNNSTTVTKTFHVCNQKIPYNVILGRTALQHLGMMLGF